MRHLDDVLFTAMSFTYTGLVLVMILACVQPDAYYFDFYGND